MNIFENLENLNVSEECFDEIMGLVEGIINEDIRSQIKKVHGKPEWGTGDRPLNKSAELMSKVSTNSGNEVSSAVDRELNKVNKKAFYQSSKKSPQTVKREFKNKIRDRQHARRYKNKNSVGRAATDIRRAQTDAGYSPEERQERNNNPDLLHKDVKDALLHRKERDNKENKYYRTDRSIKRNAVKKLKDFMKGRKSPEPKEDLSDKMDYEDKNHPSNTKSGRGNIPWGGIEIYDKGTINYNRAKEHNYYDHNADYPQLDYKARSAKYRPEVKSIARNMKKLEKRNK